MDGFAIYMLILGVIIALSYLPGMVSTTTSTQQTGGAQSKIKWLFVLFLIILSIAQLTQN